MDVRAMNLSVEYQRGGCLSSSLVIPEPSTSSIGVVPNPVTVGMYP